MLLRSLSKKEKNFLFRAIQPQPVSPAWCNYFNPVTDALSLFPHSKILTVDILFVTDKTLSVYLLFILKVVVVQATATKLCNHIYP